MPDPLGPWIQKVRANRAMHMNTDFAQPPEPAKHNPSDQLTNEGLFNIPVAIIVEKTKLDSGSLYRWLHFGGYRFLSGEWFMVREKIANGRVVVPTPYFMIPTHQFGKPTLGFTTGTAEDDGAMVKWLTERGLVALKPVVIDMQFGRTMETSWPTLGNPGAKFERAAQAAPSPSARPVPFWSAKIPKYPRPAVKAPAPQAAAPCTEEIEKSASLQAELDVLVSHEAELNALISALTGERDSLRASALEKDQGLSECRAALDRERAKNLQMEQQRADLSGEMEALKEQLKVLDGLRLENLAEIDRAKEEAAKFRAEASALADTSRVQAERIASLQSDLKLATKKLGACESVGVQLKATHDSAWAELKAARSELSKERERHASVAHFIPPTDPNSPVYEGFDSAQIADLQKQSWATLLREGVSEHKRTDALQAQVEELLQKLQVAEAQGEVSLKYRQTCEQCRANLAESKKQIEQRGEVIDRLREDAAECESRIVQAQQSVRSEEEDLRKSYVEREADRVTKLYQPHLDELSKANSDLVGRLEVATVEAARLGRERDIWKEENLKLAEELGVKSST